MITRIRIMTQADIPDFMADFRNETSGQPYFDALFLHMLLASGRDRIFLATQQDRLAGFAWCSPSPFRKREFHLDQLFVAPGFRRRGIANGLMLTFEQEAQSSGYKNLSLMVVADNERALPLYRKHGYRNLFNSLATTVSGDSAKHVSNRLRDATLEDWDFCRTLQSTPSRCALHIQEHSLNKSDFTNISRLKGNNRLYVYDGDQGPLALLHVQKCFVDENGATRFSGFYLNSIAITADTPVHQIRDVVNALKARLALDMEGELFCANYYAKHRKGLDILEECGMKTAGYLMGKPVIASP